MARKKVYKRDPKRRHSHKFIMGWEKEGGKWLPNKGPGVPVLWPPGPVTLDLTVPDVMLAHEKGGEGDTRHCAVSCLIRRQAHKFLPYAVCDVVEFADTRCYVGIGKRGHYPVKALRFEHDAQWLTEMFDKKNYLKLCRRIERNGGILEINLRPYRLRLGERSPGKQEGVSDNSRSKRHTLVRGAQRRSMRLDDRTILQVEREANFEAAKEAAAND